MKFGRGGSSHEVAAIRTSIECRGISAPKPLQRDQGPSFPLWLMKDSSKFASWQISFVVRSKVEQGTPLMYIRPANDFMTSESNGYCKMSN